MALYSYCTKKGGLANEINLIPPLLLKCLYQARKLSGHVYVCLRYRMYLYFYDCSIGFWDCSWSIVCLSLVTAISCLQMMNTNLIETSDNDSHKTQALDQNCTKLRDKNYATAK